MNENEQIELTNKLLLDVLKSQKKNINQILRMYVLTICCYTLILIAMIIGFFVYESQFEVTETVTTETTVTQEVSGNDSAINNIDGNQYNDNAIHNEN